MTDQALDDPADPNCKLFQAGQGRVSQGELAFTMPCLDLTGCDPDLALTWPDPDLADWIVARSSDLDPG